MEENSSDFYKGKNDKGASRKCFTETTPYFLLVFSELVSLDLS